MFPTTAPSAKPGSDHAAEGRIVTGAPADDDGDLARRGLRGADDAAGHTHHPVGVGVEEAFEQILRETGGVVVEAGHLPIISSHRTGATAVWTVHQRVGPTGRR